MYKRLELHNHTSESDSSLTCLELTEYMESDKVDAFALTDHNTISGHGKVKKLLKNGKYHAQCIYGLEYTTYYGHILCFNLEEYVPWDSINFHKPELLFQAVKERGGIPGIAHPFSFGAPFAKGCRFEMTVHDYSAVDFIEVFNNPEPLHEVNEKGLLWWESLVLQGHKLSATCGMDLHGKWDLAGQYATFVEGTPDGDTAAELAQAISRQKTWISKGPLLVSEVSQEDGTITFSIHPTEKPGYALNEKLSYFLTLRTENKTMEKEIINGVPITVTFKELIGTKTKSEDTASQTVIIPKLYEHSVQIEKLVCLSPVIRLDQ